jgi:nucleoside-diphosphate-sugar epimerase
MIKQKDQVLILGGHGFIGSHLLARLSELGAKITAVCFSKEKAKQDLDYHVVYADLSDATTLSDLKNMAFDYVFNLSGYIDHTPYFKGGRKVMNSHYVGLMNLLDVLDRSKLKGFVQIGSSDEYGNLASPQLETYREAPISPYSCAKLSASHLIQTLARTENFPGTVLRFFLVYGPGQDNARFLPQIIQGCLDDKAFPTSKGEQLRDFCYIDDVVDAMILAATCEKAKGEVFNIASGDPVSIKSMIQKITTLVGKGKPQFGEFPYRSGENMSLYADITKAKQLLGWAPSTDLSEGLQKTIAFYAENRYSDTSVKREGVNT